MLAASGSPATLLKMSAQLVVPIDVPIWLGALKNAVAAVAKSSWAWLKPYISAAADVVGDFAAAAAKFIRDHPPWGAQQQNLNFAGAFS